MDMLGYSKPRSDHGAWKTGNMKNRSVESSLVEAPVALVLGIGIDAGEQCLWMQNSSTSQAHNLIIITNKSM